MNLSNLDSALNKIIKKFRKNPYNYLCEFDIHAELFIHLRKKLTDLKIDIDYNYYNNDKDKNTICSFSLVRNEYHVLQTILDIAILDKDKFKRDEFEVNGNPLYKEKVDVGIEIKFNAFDLKYSFIDDINKLLNLLDNEKIKTGISILFSHCEIDYEDYPRIINNNSIINENNPDNTVNIEDKYVYSFIITPNNIKYKRFK